MSASQPLVILASASPRRTQLLAQLNIEHRIAPADIDETPKPSEDALVYVARMAASKALACTERMEPQMQESAAVLAADTTVLADGLIMGKPQNESEALGMLARLSGRTHQVATALCLRRGAKQAAACVVTHVTFRSVSAAEARAYWASGEPRDKAGGYGIQGIAANMVSKIDGSYSGVIGLPLVETQALLLALGVLSD